MSPRLPEVLTFVDVETTGTSFAYDRVIEIGIVRVENNKIKRNFSSLINPGVSVSPFILNMTGIDGKELESAPAFDRVLTEIQELLTDSVMVAHNVRFDYGFLTHEFARQDETLDLKHFCTVRLCRRLYPQLTHYNLDALISHFSLTCRRRHRAFADARVLWDIYRIARRSTPRVTFTGVVTELTRRPTLPAALPPQTLESLPQTSGVYIFYDDQNRPLYVGKSKNIRTRILSHFSDTKRNSRALRISSQLRRIETRTTGGELGALILESELVKSLQPLYNRRLRYRRQMIVAHETETTAGYRTVTWEKQAGITTSEVARVVGTFKSERSLKDSLFETARHFRLCPKLLGLEKKDGECFWSHLDRCKGACVGREQPAFYNIRFIEAFGALKFRRWPFPGPIVIQDGNTSQSGFVVDQWCIVGKVSRGETPTLPQINEPVFDTDIYKILLSFISRRSSQLQIKVLPKFINKVPDWE